MLPAALAATALLLVCGPLAAAPATTAVPLPLPGGAGGIGFDDLQFDRAGGKVLAPAGRTGSLDLIDPATHQIARVAGFSAASGEGFAGGHGEGTTSADAGAGLLFATDRTRSTVSAIDPATGKVVASARLAHGPDYVRWVGPTREVWVTEPRGGGIEVFRLAAGAGGPSLERVTFIPTPGGPESLVVDATRGRAYTHLWTGAKTLAIDLGKKAVVETWASGCKEDPQGIALDERRGFVFVGCDDGTAVVLDAAHGGKELSSLRSGRGVDIIAYDPSTAHLYLPGADSATMAIFAVAADGRLSLLDTVRTAEGAHCVTVDDRRTAYVCDPAHGQLLLIKDSFPPAGR